MDGRMQRLLLTSLLPYSMALALLLHVPARASTYQALCGTAACTVNLDANGIASQGRFIPNGRVAQWFTGGQETFDTTNGTVGAIGGGTAGAIAGGVLLGRSGWWGAWWAAPLQAPGPANRPTCISRLWVMTPRARKPPSAFVL